MEFKPTNKKVEKIRETEWQYVGCAQINPDGDITESRFINKILDIKYENSGRCGETSNKEREVKKDNIKRIQFKNMQNMRWI